MICNTCWSSPCNIFCPNAPDPPIVYTCEHCNEAIRDGEVCYAYGDSYLCESCVDDMSAIDALEYLDLSAKELLAFYGWEMEIAEVEDCFN